VFEALVDPGVQSRWVIATTVRAAGDHPVPGQVGSGLIARTAVGPFGFDDTMRVTQYRPPDRWRVQHTGRVVRGWGQWGVLPDREDPRGCRVYWAEEFEIPLGWAGRFGWAALGWLVRAGIRGSLVRLDRGLRSGVLIGQHVGRAAQVRTAPGMAASTAGEQR